VAFVQFFYQDIHYLTHRIWWHLSQRIAKSHSKDTLC